MHCIIRRAMIGCLGTRSLDGVVDIGGILVGIDLPI
jgi:hypothetical protein